MNFGDVERGVRKLDPEVRDTGDRIFNVFCDEGHWLARTKISRRPKKDLGYDLQRAIPIQLGIPKDLWVEIVGCRKSREAFLMHHGHLHT